MHLRWHVVLWIGIAALAGCTSPQVQTHIESVNAEYRQLEDYVYCLEDENARLQRQIDNVERARRGEPPARTGPFRRNATDSSDSSELSPPMIERGTPMGPPTIEIPRSSSSTPPRTNRSTLQRPKLDATPARPKNTPEPLDLGPPTIDVPQPDSGGASAPDELPPPARESTARQTSLQTATPMPEDRQVTQLFLNPLFTGGADFDGQPGNEGLSIVLEPRNAGGEYVPQAGAVSVVVLDPARQGDEARIARWDFTLTATQQKLDTTAATRGILLDMPWPAGSPANGRLKLYVRYETSDGRRLQTDREIFLTPPGQITQRWTPRSRERIASAPLPLPLGEGRGEGTPPAIPAPTSELAAAAPAAQTPPAALSSEAREKLAPPAWSPYR